MRYYGNDYLQELVREITAARDCVSYQNYALPIERTEVDLGQERQKHNGLVAARDAYTHISDIKDKYSLLIEVLTTYYRSVDEVSSNIYLMTERINSMLEHANESLVRICNILEGVGDYRGECVTNQNIHSARINQQKLSASRDEFVLLAIDAEIEGGCLSLTTIQLYMDYVRRMNFTAFTLSPEDITRLTSVWEYFVELGFGDTGDIRDIPMETIYCCIDAYELLHPTDKAILDDLFREACAQNDEIINRNVARIRYAIYTTDPEYREIMLHYIPMLSIARYDYEDTAYYNGYLNNINVDLTKDYDERIWQWDGNGDFKEENPFGAFFHELGHGIDDVSQLFGNSTDGMHDMLASELSTNMLDAFDSVYNYADRLSNDGEADLIASLTDEERQEVINFLISPSNANIVPPEGTSEDYFLPWKQDDDNYNRMIAAYNYLRNYYGYNEYRCIDNSHGFTRDGHFSTAYSDIIDDDFKHVVVNDIVGGLTNNAIAGIFGSGHLVDSDLSSDITVSNENDLYNLLNCYDYWYSYDPFVPRSPTEYTSHEFFAEMFDYHMNQTDLTVTRDMFPNSVDKYNDIIDEIYAGIQ